MAFDARIERNKVWDSMKALLDESRDNGMSAEDSIKYDRMEEELNRLDSDIKARDRAAELEVRMNEPTPIPQGLHKVDRQDYTDETKAYRSALNKHLRFRELEPQEKRLLEARAQSSNVGSQGGYLVPETLANQIFTTMKWFGSVREVAGSITTSGGGDLVIPNADDTGNTGAILDTNTVVPDDNFAFGGRTFKAWIYTSKLIKVPWDLVDDVEFDLESWIVARFGERLGRIQNTHFTAGVGAVQPEGFLTNATQVTSGTNDSLKLADAVTLIYSVDRAYRSRGSFQMNDQAIATLRKEQSTTGEFVWQPSAQAGEPDRLFGYPVYSNSDMTTTPSADASLPMAFGDFGSGYLIRDVRGISIVTLKERFGDFMQTGYFAYLRTEGQPTYQSATNTPPYKALKIA